MASSAASLDDLKDALKETLESKGVLGQIKARVRAEIFASLDEQVGAKGIALVCSFRGLVLRACLYFCTLNNARTGQPALG